MPQSLAKIIVHIIFSTKERYPFLEDKKLQKDTFAYIAEIFKQKAAHALIVGGTENHAHILCNSPRTEGISKIIGEVKRCSSIWIKTKGEKLKNFQWQKGYGVFSIGQSQVDTVTNYIKNQDTHHKKTSFKIPRVAICQKPADCNPGLLYLTLSG